MKICSRIAAMVVLSASVSLVAVSPALATPIITSYDILNAEPSGFGLWSHTYSGTINPIGGGLVNYSGGSGTLNDGSLGTSIGDTQLFSAAVNPIITLHLDAMYRIDSISLFGGNFLFNAIPGVLDSVSVSFGGPSVNASDTPFGFVGSHGPVSDRFTLTGTALADILTNTIVLSNFGGPLFEGDLFSIAEIQVADVIPEPATLVLLGTGLVVVAGRRRAAVRRVI